MQRIRYGLTGLALVFLIVLLGTAIVRSSGEPEANSTNASAPSDPLSELGVAPGQNPEENQVQNGAEPR
jgi:hypothetical protein